VQYTEYELGELLPFEQPTAYIVKSTDYSDAYATPVLTAGKSFILGKTNETDGIFDQLPVIIFDDFTTATQFVNFRFKVKSSAMKILHINTDLVIPKYIFYRLQIIQFDHSTHKRYWIQSYSKIKVSIPSLDEQSRIVSRIDELFSELDKAVDTLNTTKEQLAVYRQAVLKDAFSNIPREMYKPLKLVMEEMPQNGLYKSKSFYGEGNPILRIDGFYDGEVVPNYEYKRVRLEAEEIKKYALHIGDIVVNRVNSMSYLGKCALIRNLEEPTIFESNVMRFRLDKQQIDLEYAMYYLSTSFGRHELIKNAKQAVNQASINQTDVGNALIPIPKDLEAQRNIAQKISAHIAVCNNIEQGIDTAFAQADAMRQSILKQSFEEKI
jgi:putative phosphoribosylformylglycinamidine synthase (fragment)